MFSCTVRGLFLIIPSTRLPLLPAQMLYLICASVEPPPILALTIKPYIRFSSACSGGNFRFLSCSHFGLSNVSEDFFIFENPELLDTIWCTVAALVMGLVSLFDMTPSFNSDFLSSPATDWLAPNNPPNFRPTAGESLPTNCDLFFEGSSCFEDRKSTRLNSSHSQISY